MIVLTIYLLILAVLILFHLALKYRSQAKLMKDLYLLAESQRQEALTAWGREIGVKPPKFHSHLQDEMDFPEKSPLFYD